MAVCPGHAALGKRLNSVITPWVVGQASVRAPEFRSGSRDAPSLSPVWAWFGSGPTTPVIAVVETRPDYHREVKIFPTAGAGWGLVGRRLSPTETPKATGKSGPVGGRKFFGPGPSGPHPDRGPGAGEV